MLNRLFQIKYESLEMNKIIHKNANCKKAKLLKHSDLKKALKKFNYSVS